MAPLLHSQGCRDCYGPEPAPQAFVSRSIPGLSGAFNAMRSTRSVSTSVASAYAARADELLAAVPGVVGAAVVMIDADYRIIAFNRGAEGLFGYAAADVLEQPLDLLLPPEARAHHGAQVESFRREGTPIRTIAERELVHGLRRDGSRFVADASVASLHLDGEWIGVAVIHDISSYVEARQALQTSLEQQRLLADTDALTGLWNRRALIAALSRELSRLERGDNPFTLVYLDMDHFKLANDRYGHALGDQLLITVADRLRTFFRAMDFAARVGGDEFVVLAPISASTEMHTRMETLCAELRADMRGQGVEEVTFSIGALTCAAPATSAEAALHAADTLMYRVKHGGRDGVCSGLLDETGLRGADGRPMGPIQAAPPAREA